MDLPSSVPARMRAKARLGLPLNLDILLQCGRYLRLKKGMADRFTCEQRRPKGAEPQAKFKVGEFLLMQPGENGRAVVFRVTNRKGRLYNIKILGTAGPEDLKVEGASGLTVEKA